MSRSSIHSVFALTSRDRQLTQQRQSSTVLYTPTIHALADIERPYWTNSILLNSWRLCPTSCVSHTSRVRQLSILTRLLIIREALGLLNRFYPVRTMTVLATPTVSLRKWRQNIGVRTSSCEHAEWKKLTRWLYPAQQSAPHIGSRSAKSPGHNIDS